MKTKAASDAMKASALTALAMLAFAGNSILCRHALKNTDIDPASFTSIRILSGALVLGLLIIMRSRTNPTPKLPGSWLSALALFIYAAAFSFAYVSLTAATGALILFGAVQITMIGYGLYKGERPTALQVIGMALAFGGLIALMLPGLSAPPLAGAALMGLAGIAWGVYSLRGRGVGDSAQITAGNFLRAVPFALLLSLVLFSRAKFDIGGVLYAIASGALASGIGYALWYAVLPVLKNTVAASVQLSVPVIAAFGGVLLISEPLTLRLTLTSIAILGGIALVITKKSA